MRIATIVLNRNLPKVTNTLCENLLASGVEKSDLFVLESGSEESNISKFCTWYIRDSKTLKNGLRYNRGMNQALINLYQSPSWENYEAFLLLTNDTEFLSQEPILNFEKVLERHPRVAIVSPCAKSWGEANFIDDNGEKYFWSIGTTAMLVRREFIELVGNLSGLSNTDFFFDGNNYRGYLSDIEIVAKAYLNDWAVAITKAVYAEENDHYLLNFSEIIKTDNYAENLKLYVEEGLFWAKNKYGFQSKWDFVKYSKLNYDMFFTMNPELIKFKV